MADKKVNILYEVIEGAPGALASKDAALITSSYSANLQEDYIMVKMEGYIQWRAGSSNESVIVGIADGALTSAQIEECLEATPVDSNDVPETEQAQRAVFPLCMLNSSDSGGVQVANIEKTLRWIFKNADAWNFWVYNPDNAAITTGGDILVFMKYFGSWLA